MTAAQRDLLDRLASTRGRVHVREGFAGGEVRFATPDGAEYIVPEHGVPTVSLDLTVNWQDETLA